MAGTHGLPRSAADGSQRLRLDRRRFDEARYSFERIALAAESVSAFVDPKRIFDFPHKRQAVVLTAHEVTDAGRGDVPSVESGHIQFAASAADV